MSFEPGDIVDARYHLRQKLGAGGFGEVWLAEQPELRRSVAIKMLGKTLDHESKVRFRRETRALGRISHEHIVEFFHSGHTDHGVAFIVTEYVQGQSLRAWAAGRSVDEIIEVTRQITSALDAAHREGMIHRDLKPANVLVTVGPGGGPHVKVLDFGLARLTGRTPHDVTKTGEVIGTPGYMSPEQLRGRRDIGPATDLYCLGVVLWELLEGRRIFSAETALGISMMHLMEPPPPLTRAVPHELAQLTTRLLQKEPDQRPHIAGAVRTLDALAGGAPPPRLPAARRERSSPAASSAVTRRSMAFALLAGAALGLVVAGVLFVGEKDDRPPSPLPPPIVGERNAESTPARQVPVPALLEVPDSPSRPPPQPTANADAGDARDAAPGADLAGMLPTPGCGRKTGWKPGERQHITYHGREILVYVPSSYDPKVPLPLVVLIHGAAQEPEEMLDEAAMESLADEHRFLLMAPEGDRLSPFKGGGMAKFAWRTDGVAFRQIPARIGGVMTALCVDASRLFVVGHGRGGYAALQQLTISDRFAAVATTSHRRARGGSYPIPRVRVPYLFITPTKSPKLPDDGRTNDCQPDQRVPFTEQDRTVREHYGCRGEERPWPTSDGATCVTWDCEVPYIRCRVDGGRHWYDYPSDNRRCAGPVSTYDYAGEIWRFFQQVDSGGL